MSMHRTDKEENLMQCWDHRPERPWPELLKMLKAGPFSSDVPDLEDLITSCRREHVEKPIIFVGTGTCGLGAGAGKTLESARSYLHDRHLDAGIVEVGCIGICSEEPLLDVQLPGRTRVSFKNVTGERVPELLDAALKDPNTVDGNRLLGQFRDPALEAWEAVPYLDEHPFFAPQKRWVLANCGILDPTSIDEYIARGGYSALARALNAMTPSALADMVEESGLRGRGGAGFPTGRKWKLAQQASGDQKYLICNADEGDPGAFMDRAVIEGDPHRLLEGMVLGAYAIGASRAYIYIRAEYPLAVRRLRRAMDQMKEYGLLGTDILGSGFDLDIVIKMGAGAFVCGEETALIASIEGRRGMPRPRPPFPATEGLFGKPTIINNVETLANLPGLMRLGADGFSAVGTESSKGTKVFALSGTVSRTGLVEVPMGTSVRDIVFGIGGGIPGGKRCKAVQIGGPSGGCIPEAHMDIEIDYESLKNFGAIMGSGGLVVMDEGICMVDLAKFFMGFIQSESCGKCIPCREGTQRMLETLEAITQNRRSESNLDALLRFQGVMHLKQLAEVIQDTALCGLGQTAPNPVLSTLRWFRDEYEAHIFERRCPAGVCRELVGAPCQNACPVGTEVWRYVAHIGRGEYEEAYRVIREANPFPSVCARVCNHPCETICRSGTTGADPIAVRALKRFVTDSVDPSVYATAIQPTGDDAPKVAIVGAGPSGLTAAHYLSKNGYRVTLFERESRPGGMLVCAVPEYRLPRDLLSREINALLNGNVELRCNAALGREYTIDGLFEEGFQAVYVSVGSHTSRRLDLEGEDAAGVHSGMEFLKAFNLHNEEWACGRVGVIGGGNSAVDAARVAIRQKDVESVTIFYRRTRKEMPAYEEEIEAAREEGIQIVPLVSPTAILSESGQLTDVVFIRNELGAQDASGRPRPVPMAGSEHTIPLDTLIVAIGEQTDVRGLEGVEVTRNGTISANVENLSTSRPGVFSGGDVVTGPNTVIEAIAAGKRAALMIARYVTGKQLTVIDKVKLPTVYVEPPEGMEDGDQQVIPRAEPPTLPVELRQHNVDEVELCLTAEDAIREARRCLRCDLEFTQPIER